MGAIKFDVQDSKCHLFVTVMLRLFIVLLNTTSTRNLDQGGLCSDKYGLIVLCSHLFGRRMVRIFAGYTIEQDELVRFLTAQGWGPEPGEPQFTVDEAWMTFLSWRGAQPRNGDPKTLFPWPVCVTIFLSYVLIFEFLYRLV